MTTHRKGLILGLMASLGLLLVVGRSAQAQVTYNYSLDTASLNPASTYYLYFQLTAGTGPSNTITVNSFGFGGGTEGDIPATLPPPPPSPNPVGGVTTDGTIDTAPSYLTLDDSSNFFSYVGVAFNPGSSLQFNITSSNNLVDESDFIPDEFAFAILDSSGDNLPTTAPDYSDSLIELTLGYPDGSAEVADYQTFQLSTVPVPESGNMALVLMVPLFARWFLRNAAARRAVKVTVD